MNLFYEWQAMLAARDASMLAIMGLSVVMLAAVAYVDSQLPRPTRLSVAIHALMWLSLTVAILTVRV